MAIPAIKQATYEDVLNAPAHMVAEIVGGQLRLHPRPAKPHTAATTALGEELGPPFKRGRGGPGGWINLNQPELHFGADVLVPDMAGWRRERMAAIVADEAYFTLAPDWIVEVLSPSTEKYDRTDKLEIYAREGVPWAWLVEPVNRTLEVLQLGEDRNWILRAAYRDNAVVRAQPFDAIELDLAIRWADVIIPDRK